MKKLTSLILVLIIAASANVFCQSSPFNGEWKLNREKSHVPDGQVFLTKLKVTLKTDSLLTTRTYEDPNGSEYPFDENLTLDGKLTKLTVYDMPRSARATKNDDGSILAESKTTFYNNGGADSLMAKETWRTKADTLAIEYTNSMSGQEFKGVSYFVKVK